MSLDSDLTQVRRKAEEQGFRYKVTEKGHHQFYSPNGEDIVTTGGTPSDGRSWANFMADMRRAGFREEFAVRKDEKPVRLNQPTSKWIIAELGNHPQGMYARDIHDYVHKVNPGSAKTAVQNALNGMLKTGKALLDRKTGIYTLPPLKAPAGTREITELARQTASPPTIHAALSITGDSDIDADLRLLDEALAALAKIEAVIQGNREKLHKIAEFKKMFR